MDIPLKLKKDFERTLEDLKRKYGEDFEILNGIHESQINFSDFIDAFVDKNLNDVTIDNNANASGKDIASLRSEKGKPTDKLIALNKIFYDHKKMYGLKSAKEWLETEYNGGFYLHDAPSSTYIPYCYAYDLTRLAKEGLFFLKNYNNKGPQHLTTFIDDVIEFISYFSNRSSGAVGLPNVLVWTFYFWKHDCENGYYIKDPDYYLRQSFQKLIYRLNQPFIRVDQSAFVNCSIFDQSYYEALFGGVEFPDGTFAIDYTDEFIEHEKIFMEVVSQIREENFFTFPVLTYSLLKRADITEEEAKEMLRTKNFNVFVNNDFARWCSDHNTKWNDSNFFMSSDVTTLSNCPLAPDTKILYWSEYYHRFMSGEISQVYNNLKDDKKKSIKVLGNGKLINCRINKFDIPANYKITLVNGQEIVTTENHLNKVLGKDYVETKDLTTDDYLPVSMIPYEGSDSMSYEDGKLVGMFLGDGSYRNNRDVAFSLNSETDKDDIEFLEEYCHKHFYAKIGMNLLKSDLSQKYSCVNVNVCSTYLRGLIEQFVEGDNALNKALNLRAIGCSKEFRRGIIDGLYTTDGGNSNRIYTSSERLKDSLVTLFASMGIPTTILKDDREGRLWKNTNYTIRWYTPEGRTQRKDVYKIEGDNFWFKIKSIEKLKLKGRNGSYCLEVLDEDVEPVFMLSNGIQTHNCRLLSDTSKLKGFINSIGGTALSIGSIKVNTINLVHIYYELGEEVSEKKYLQILRKRAQLCCKTLSVIRHIISRNIQKGLLPNYCDGGVDMAHQYSTLGILGLYETIDRFGYVETDEFGNKSYTQKGIDFASEIFKVLNDVKDNFTTEYSHNIESVPAERAAVNLCAKDRTLFDVDDYTIYSNQWIPLTEKCTIQEKVKLSSILDEKCSGGAIAHINLDSNFANTDQAWDMLNYIALNNVFYFAFNTKINVCENRHGFIGTDVCPHCGKPVYDTYQRIVGFLVPSKSYSKERFKEFSARQWYNTAVIHGETSVIKD